MVFGFAFGKKWRMRKLISAYIDFRVKEKRAFEEHMKRLLAQLHAKKIEKKIYERLRTVLEFEDFQKQEDSWAKIQNKFRNPLNS